MFEYEALHVDFGARITGVDLASPLSDDEREAAHSGLVSMMRGERIFSPFLWAVRAGVLSRVCSGGALRSCVGVW